MWDASENGCSDVCITWYNFGPVYSYTKNVVKNQCMVDGANYDNDADCNMYCGKTPTCPYGGSWDGSLKQCVDNNQNCQTYCGNVAGCLYTPGTAAVCVNGAPQVGCYLTGDMFNPWALQGSATTCTPASCSYSPSITEIVVDGMNDQCTGYESDQNCSLQSETVDGVNTVVNYQPTGLTPMPSCKTITGLVSHVICHNWWVKNRVYQCKKANQYDFSDTKRRTSVIVNSTAGTAGQSMNYNDAPRDANGNIIQTSGTADLSQSNISGSTCDKACKTVIAVPKTQAGVSGNTAQYQSNATTNKFSYYKCKGTVCPAGAGETIKVDCQCINDFAEAASIMSALDSASKDMICSQ